jgi:hypothetical protein
VTFCFFFRYDTTPATGNGTINKIIHNSIDNWYRVTCNASNWFNEECRGFTQCGLSSMNSVAGRPEAAQGNLSGLIDSVITPNGMYGEMVYQSHPNEFSPVSESAYCAAGVLHTMLLHTNVKTGILSIFPGTGTTWANASFYHLRADGGLLVSASKANGCTVFVSLETSTPLPGPRKVQVIVPEDRAW